MIWQLIIVTSVYFITINSIRSYFTLAKTVFDGVPRYTVSPRAGAADASFWESLNIGWKLRTVLWDGLPPYEKALEILRTYSCVFVRMFYFTNWTSAGRLVLCSDLNTIKEAFRSYEWVNRFHDDHYFYMGSFGKPLGILLGNGSYWKTARKIVMKGFRDHGMMDASHLEELFHEEIGLVLNDLSKRLNESTTGAAVLSANHIFDDATLNAIFKMLFSRKINKKDPLENGLADQMNYNNDNVALGMSAIDFFPFLKYFPMMVPSLRENLKLFNAIYDIIVNEHQRRTKVDSNYQDLMNTFLMEVEAHEGSNPNYFTFENLQTTIRDLIMAGSDTTHVTLEHLFLFMATNTKEQKKVQEEIDRVIGADRFPTYEDRKSMIYTQAVIQETWRLGSITPASFRMNSADCQLGGMDIKKGTYLIPLYIGVNHSKDVWEDAMQFKPSRFISETGQITNTDKTLTFSYGPRACPGELVGRVAVFLFTVVLLREFEWELSDVHPPPSSQYHGGMTRTPAEYFVKIRRRRSRC